MKLTNFIPQIFYDIIARLIPGMAVIVTAIAAYHIFKGDLMTARKVLSNINPPEIALFLLISYLASILLYGIWSILLKFKLLKKFLTYERDIIHERQGLTKRDIKIGLDTLVKKEFSPIENIEFPNNSFIYDYIRFKQPDIGSRLVKLRAECHMCSVLIVGWSLIALTNPVVFLSISSSYSVGWKAVLLVLTELILVIGITGVILFYRHMEERFVNSLKNHWAILCIDQMKKTIKTSAKENNPLKGVEEKEG